MYTNVKPSKEWPQQGAISFDRFVMRYREGKRKETGMRQGEIMEEDNGI